ncbi:unnamed protein product [Mycena citricolor]|uniref:Uncharacterized protein n=1 Tax=Mycena citricolor TaxID=2018698 RepID=A0AAD2HFX0_9AGAR|nr:unnamed protein product [Mycena citricolor]
MLKSVVRRTPSCGVLLPMPRSLESILNKRAVFTARSAVVPGGRERATAGNCMCWSEDHQFRAGFCSSLWSVIIAHYVIPSQRVDPSKDGLRTASPPFRTDLSTWVTFVLRDQRSMS